jgi:hypothetical protein
MSGRRPARRPASHFVLHEAGRPSPEDGTAFHGFQEIGMGAAGERKQPPLVGACRAGRRSGHGRAISLADEVARVHVSFCDFDSAR